MLFFLRVETAFYVFLKSTITCKVLRLILPKYVVFQRLYSYNAYFNERPEKIFMLK